MAYQEDKQGKMKRQTSRQAITLAMQGRWQEAITVNKNIIQSYPNDVDAFNRLGKAQMELGQYSEAREAYEKAVKLDPYNTIGKKNLERLALLEARPPAPASTGAEKAEPDLFIAEIGKAEVVTLYHPAPRETLVKMMAGDKLVLKPQDSSLAVESLHGDYLGLVPARHGQRLMKLMDGGNKYSAAVVNSTDRNISVIIRETYQDPSLIDQVSFPGKRLEEVQPYVSDRALRPEYEEEEEAVEVAATGEEGESAEEVSEEVAPEEEKEWEQEA